LRGGYTRTHDYAYTNILLNIWSSFPFVAAVSSFPTVATTNLQGQTVNVIANAFGVLQNPPFDPNTVNRTVVDGDFHMPVYDSYSLEFQREFTRDLVLRVGYVGTRGTGLFESVDANPTRIGCTVANAANNFCRSIPNQGPTRLRTNSGSSIYHSLQTSLEKRLSSGFSAGLHYTYSSFIDTMSEIFNVSSGEIAVAQDSYNRRADRGRSSFDRPHRLAGNFVYELPLLPRSEGCYRPGSRRLAAQLAVLVAEWFAVHAVEWFGSRHRAREHLVAGRQCHQAEREHNARSFVDEC
jgi:hypothetical protein